MAQPLVLHYWGIKARGYLPAVVAAVGGVPLEWNKTPDWPAFKANCPFGQLPTLVGPDGFALGQSLAIVRYLARLGKLQGDTDKEFAMSEQLIQEGEDLYGALAKAHYTPDRTGAMDAFFATGLKSHLDALAKLLTGETFTGRLLTGDLAIYVAFDILTNLQADCLDGHPTLKAFLARVGANEKVQQASAGLAMYFKRTTDVTSQ